MAWCRGLPMNPLARFMAPWGSKFVGSPPWQSWQRMPLARWMSWGNFSAGGVTRGSPIPRWHSMHEFPSGSFCASARPPASSSAPITSAGTSTRRDPRMLFPPRRHVAQQAQHEDVGHDPHADPEEERAFLPPGRLSIQKRDEQQEQASHPEAEHPDQLAVDRPDLGGDVFQGLEHKHEVPLGPD